ncbi:MULTISPECIES: sugar ABC transporter substrate-binding protein [unclassified Vibrio]|uniref:Sugar ABC transporter substrate-binding protein n=1 Tax=Vibrio sp. HB236076 TaxID=3232307 RepID=A0AB39HI43_9VIBR|nr:sugar ABC transporter substrate-binding protein [Vibrio sp. HB161653]MDP5253132.1 sugar ABC transporter substrate-binding protein [Vibrio sp. HB161653]
MLLPMQRLNRLALALFCPALFTAHSLSAVELNIATVNNGHMIAMQSLGEAFEKQYPDIQLNWHTFNEGSLRMRVIADIASQGANYDVITLGMYETPIWAERGWLTALKPDAQYQVDDLLPKVREGLSYQSTLYAAPFYGESSTLMYRKDLFEQAGISLKQRPTWQQIQQYASQLHKPEQQQYGICLRGKAGWGDNMALVTTLVNSFGGQWFNNQWQPQINGQVWQQAVRFYVDLLTQFGPPQPQKNSFNEILSMSRDGHCAMWVDASVAGSFLLDSQKSQYADQWGFAQTPYQATTKGANWLWAWALAIPSGSQQADAAQTFINWATSKQYIELVAQKQGWGKVPTGTRQSTYQNEAFLAATGEFASEELKALNSADPKNNTLPPSPYQGIQFASIPEFVSIAGYTSQKVAQALSGELSVEEALNASQTIAERQLKRAGYYSQGEGASPVNLDLSQNLNLSQNQSQPEEAEYR